MTSPDDDLDFAQFLNFDDCENFDRLNDHGGRALPPVELFEDHWTPLKHPPSFYPESGYTIPDPHAAQSGNNNIGTSTALNYNVYCNIFKEGSQYHHTGPIIACANEPRTTVGYANSGNFASMSPSPYSSFPQWPMAAHAPSTPSPYSSFPQFPMPAHAPPTPSPKPKNPKKRAAPTDELADSNNQPIKTHRGPGRPKGSKNKTPASTNGADKAKQTLPNTAALPNVAGGWGVKTARNPRGAGRPKEPKTNGGVKLGALIKARGSRPDWCRKQMEIIESHYAEILVSKLLDISEDRDWDSEMWEFKRGEWMYKTLVQKFESLYMVASPATLHMNLCLVDVTLGMPHLTTLRFEGSGEVFEASRW